MQSRMVLAFSDTKDYDWLMTISSFTGTPRFFSAKQLFKSAFTHARGYSSQGVGFHICSCLTQWVSCWPRYILNSGRNNWWQKQLLHQVLFCIIWKLAENSVSSPINEDAKWDLSLYWREEVVHVQGEAEYEMSKGQWQKSSLWSGLLLHDSSSYTFINAAGLWQQTTF